MKITLYFTGDEDGKLTKDFLKSHNIQFEEVLTNDLTTLQKIAHFPLQRKVSLLEIRKNRGIQVIMGFIERDLEQLIEHIEKYKPKINTE